MTDPVREFEPVAFQNWTEKGSQSCSAMCVADCDGDGEEEILLVGQNIDANNINGELRVIKFQPPGKLVLAGRHKETARYTPVECVCAADVDNDNRIEIITGGCKQISWESRPSAHLQVLVWDGDKLHVKAERIWLPDPEFIQKKSSIPIYITGATITSVVVDDIDQDGNMEIVCGGILFVRVGYPDYNQIDLNIAWVEIFDWTQPLATRRYPKVQHAFWDLHSSDDPFPLENNNVSDVACADIDNDGSIEIITVGNTEWGGELYAWGVRQGDAGLELFRKAERRWYDWGAGSKFFGSLRVRVGNLRGEQGLPEIATGASAYIGGVYYGSSLLSRYDADMRIWRLFGWSFHHVTGGVFPIKSPSGHFLRSGCSAIFIADIDGDRQNELLSVHDIRVPRSDTVSLGCVIAWDPKKDWSSAPREENWKRKFIFGIDSEDGEALPTFLSGIWATDIDHDGRIETILSGGYGRPLESGVSGVFAAIIR
jgi:hypothetical protein